jgi:hypothetical protein
MKRIVPSTRGQLTVVVRRVSDTKHSDHHDVRFGAIREHLNHLLEQHDQPDNRVRSLTATFQVKEPPTNE